MNVLVKFSKRLFNVDPVSDLEKRWKIIDMNSPYYPRSEADQEEVSMVSPVMHKENSSLGPLMNNRRTRAKLADMAARSYWRCDKSPTRVTLRYRRSATSPITVKLSYGKCAHNSSSITANNLQTTVR